MVTPRRIASARVAKRPSGRASGRAARRGAEPGVRMPDLKRIQATASAVKGVPRPLRSPCVLRAAAIASSLRPAARAVMASTTAGGVRTRAFFSGRGTTSAVVASEGHSPCTWV
jgi:hypothetical protein